MPTPPIAIPCRSIGTTATERITVTTPRKVYSGSATVSAIRTTERVRIARPCAEAGLIGAG